MLLPAFSGRAEKAEERQTRTWIGGIVIGGDNRSNALRNWVRELNMQLYSNTQLFPKSKYIKLYYYYSNHKHSKHLVLANLPSAFCR
jgi:hypothetical protein